MDGPPPPPPPPHGSQQAGGGGQNGSGLPPGKYDIFVIPPHSAGGGFLYLPSLQPHRNSFLAGVACTLAAVGIYTVVLPILKEWFRTVIASGGAGVLGLMAVMGVVGWAWGKTQFESASSSGNAGGSSSTGNNGHTGQGTNPSAGPNFSQNAGPPPGGAYPPGGGFPPGGGPHEQSYANPGYGGHGYGGHQPSGQHYSQHGFAGTPQTEPEPASKPQPKSSWQRKPAAGASSTPPKGAWERAREEARKKEEERKKNEEIQKRAEELAAKKAEEERERQRLREKEAKERKEREEKRAKEREQRAKEREEKDRVNGSAASSKPPPSTRPSSPKKPPHPTARTEADEETYSYRPYDKPKTAHTYKSSAASSIYSENSYHTHSTRRTTPPPSHRGPYSTKDPDKIVIRAVYAFNNAFNNLPIAQLNSGKGSVTDGLILRITTEGLFIDDDVRGVPQREWDVKAWTMKLVEVWCPHMAVLGASSGSSSRGANANGRSTLFGFKSTPGSMGPTSEESDNFLEKLKPLCRLNCARSNTSWESRSNFSSSQTGEMRGLHVLRATIRDQDGKRYVFILSDDEAWKVAIGLQRLRKGSQVRALGVSGMPINETKAILTNMGFV